MADPVPPPGGDCPGKRDEQNGGGGSQQTGDDAGQPISGDQDSKQRYIPNSCCGSPATAGVPCAEFVQISTHPNVSKFPSNGDERWSHGFVELKLFSLWLMVIWTFTSLFVINFVLCMRHFAHSTFEFGTLIKFQHHNRPEVDGSVNITIKNCADNTLKKLQLREIGFMPGSFSRERFTGVKKQEIKVDLFQDTIALGSLDSSMTKKSDIVQILPVKDVILFLSRSGLCGTFSRATNKLIAILTKPHERIQDIFYNKPTNSLIILSGRNVDDYTKLQLRAVPIESLRTKNKIECPIFESVEIKWPGCVVFDAINDKALIIHERTYQVFDLKNYSFIYKIPEVNVRDIFCRPQALLVMNEQRGMLLQLIIRCIETGDKLNSVDHLISGNIKFIDMVNEKILIRGRDKNLEIINVRNSEKTEVSIGTFKFHPLHRRNLFLTFQESSTEIRYLNGIIIKKLDNALWRSNSLEYNLSSTTDDDAIIFVGKSKVSETGSVNILPFERGMPVVSTFDPRVQVTSISYNDDLNEFYIGTTRGRVYVFSV